jgi:hypothetical protein
MKEIFSPFPKKTIHLSVALSIFASLIGSDTVWALTVQQAACSAVGGGAPLSKSDIEARGSKLGFKLDSNTMGRAFQNFVLDSIRDVENILPFYSPARDLATKKYIDPARRHKYVVPDGSGPIIIFIRDQNRRVISTQYYAMSAFEEVKFHRGTIYLSSFEHQITGFVDVLGTISFASKAPIALGSSRPTPRLTFHTTSDSSIAPSVIKAATRLRVGIWQQIACDYPATPSPTDMIMSFPIPLNSPVYAGFAPPSGVPPSKPSGLR